MYQQFIEHHLGLTKKKLHVVYLKALGLPHKEIERIVRISDDYAMVAGLHGLFAT